MRTKELQALTDLFLLQESIAFLKELPYFRSHFNTYLDDLNIAIEYCIANQDNLDSVVLIEATSLIWNTYKYLSGSTTREITYELEYCLRKVVEDWHVNSDCIITTAHTTDYSAFHFWSVNVLQRLSKILNIDFSSSKLSIINLALPKFYKNNLVLCIPMYHEVGHFIDDRYTIGSRATILIKRRPDLLNYLGFTSPNDSRIANHMAEYFADLFAASYIGNSLSKFLNHAANGNLDSYTHPATDRRCKIIDDFCSGQKNDVVDFFNHLLSAMTLPVCSRDILFPVYHQALIILGHTRY